MIKNKLPYIFFLTLCCFSQNKQLLYNLNGVPQSLLLNPGSDINYKWYFGVPLLSGISVGFSSSRITANDLFVNDGVNFNTKLLNATKAASRDDKLIVSEQIEILNGGFKIGNWQKNEFVSFGIYQELELLLYVPKDYALFYLDGNANYIGKKFNLADLEATADAVSVFHLGYNKKINKKFTVGARAKIYSSTINLNTTQNSGSFYTNQQVNGTYEQGINADISVKNSGITNLQSNLTKGIAKKVLLGGNLGSGLDFGLTYYPKNELQMTASLVDIGFITHFKDSKKYIYKGNYIYNGLEPNFTSGGEDIAKQFENVIALDTINSSYTTMRRAKFNASIQYSFNDRENRECNCTKFDSKGYKNSVGAQLFAMSTPRGAIAALTGYYKRFFFDAVEIKTTYTVDAFSTKNIGFGIAAQLGKFNLYILADNLLEYRDISKANSLSVQFGVNIVALQKDNFD